MVWIMDLFGNSVFIGEKVKSRFLIEEEINKLSFGLYVFVLEVEEEDVFEEEKKDIGEGNFDGS